MHLPSIISFASLIYPTSDSPDSSEPSTSVLWCLGLGSTLGFSLPKCERLQGRTFDDSILDFPSAGPVEHPKAPRHFFKKLGHKLDSHGPPGGPPSVSTYSIVG